MALTLMVNKRIKFVSTLAVIQLSAISAHAYCYEPSAPDAPYGGPPSAPYCFNEWDKTHTCSSYEIDSWIDEINHYIRKMVDYAEEAQDFANEAVDFARCQIDKAKEPLE